MPAESLSKESGAPAFQLRITLEGVTPPVWRRLLVPGGVRLSKLHAMIQVAMGWNDSHLHSFDIGDARYGMHADDYPEDEIDETRPTVSQAIRTERDSTMNSTSVTWDHEIVVEDMMGRS